MEAKPAVKTSSVSPPTATQSDFLRWEEVVVDKDKKGRKEIRYVLKRKDGGSDLVVVVGKERSSRRIRYRYVMESYSGFEKLDLANSFGRKKLESRKDVVDWLNSIVEVSRPRVDVESYLSKQIHDGNVKRTKKHDDYTEGFLWLGSPWICEKRRRHYPSFMRNGVEISVNDFVYVLAEEGKHLVAYLKDLYEDSRGNKMVMVQWFHKIDEVDIDLSEDVNVKEVFFSHSTQRLSIECIDGSATVLAPLQFKKFMDKTIHNEYDPYLCRKQFNNGEVKPIDITQIKGYWNQRLVKLLCADYSSKAYVNCEASDGLVPEETYDELNVIRSKKKQRQIRGIEVSNISSRPGELVTDFKKLQQCHAINNTPFEVTNIKGSLDVAASLSRINATKQNPVDIFTVGSQIEVLSQDSGVRGCWFKALIIKKHKNKVKVRYLDLKDAENEANTVEEWILSSKVSTFDQLETRGPGRKIIRPVPELNKGRVSWAVDTGSAVDVWWNDRWWEGLVIQKESDDKFRVYFPGEKQESVFGREDLRISQEWVESQWTHVKDRLDLVTKILSIREVKQADRKSTGGIKIRLKTKCNGSEKVTKIDKSCNEKKIETCRDLLKDKLFTQLKWGSRKRRYSSLNDSGSDKFDCKKTNRNRSPEVIDPSCVYGNFIMPSSLKADAENCKYLGDTRFISSVVPPLTSMVLSR